MVKRIVKLVCSVSLSAEKLDNNGDALEMISTRDEKLVEWCKKEGASTYEYAQRQVREFSAGRAK